MGTWRSSLPYGRRAGGLPSGRWRDSSSASPYSRSWPEPSSAGAALRRSDSGPAEGPQAGTGRRRAGADHRIVFDDTGEILPDGRVVAPSRLAVAA
ncbi:DUF5999 family protein [Streptomyces ossamyceticus]|uniref:DUF5999 family protein n=1 Tax=Streptomyces ossamyceticus TaxID=249581 RepID=A0ABV2V2I1_9ACTN